MTEPTERGSRWDADRAGGLPAVCAGCGKVMRRGPRPDGAPSFCADNRCKAKRANWRYANDPAFRESVRRTQTERNRALRETGA